ELNRPQLLPVSALLPRADFAAALDDVPVLAAAVDLTTGVDLPVSGKPLPSATDSTLPSGATQSPTDSAPEHSSDSAAHEGVLHPLLPTPTSPGTSPTRVLAAPIGISAVATASTEPSRQQAPVPQADVGPPALLRTLPAIGSEPLVNVPAPPADYLNGSPISPVSGEAPAASIGGQRQPALTTASPQNEPQKLPEPIPRPTPRPEAVVVTPATVNLDEPAIPRPPVEQPLASSRRVAGRDDRPLSQSASSHASLPQPLPERDIDLLPVSRPVQALATGPAIVDMPAPTPVATAAQALPATVNFAMHAAAPAGPNTPATPASSPTPMQIDTPVRDAAWGERIGERILVMASHRLQSAEIRLSPAELGPIRVQVAIDEAGLNVNFQAQHVVTREAIEQAMPRLRELFADSGLNLNQTTVANDGNPSDKGVQSGNRDDGRMASTASTEDHDADEEQQIAETDVRQWRLNIAEGRVDTFV
ncbi:MAG: flagellar hook-length control protein FliK, partial [Gammaproteobacteria bacterium]|nr:flagellar hook-length control protein FliK [Gammaproteobacteria bacterium]